MLGVHHSYPAASPGARKDPIAFRGFDSQILTSALADSSYNSQSASVGLAPELPIAAGTRNISAVINVRERFIRSSSIMNVSKFIFKIREILRSIG